METSEDLISRILDNGPSPGTLHLLLTKMREEGLLRRVIQECLKALRVHPRDMQVRKILAETYLEAGLLSQAESEFEKVAGQISDAAVVYGHMAEIYRRQGRSEESAEALRRYTALGPETLGTQPPPEDAVSTAAPPGIEAGTPPSAEAQALPEIATPTLAEIYFEQGQVREAAEVYEKVLARDPQDAESRCRHEALKTMLAEQAAADARKPAAAAGGREARMIRILESWLAGLQGALRTPSA